MAHVVVEVGPGGVRRHPRGPHPDPELAAAALHWIDDPVGLFADQPVPSVQLLRDLLASLVAGCDSVQIVHPADWPASRVSTLLAAARPLAARVTAVGRDRWTVPRRHRPARWRGPALAATGALAAAAVLVGSANLRGPHPPPAGPVGPDPVSLVEGPVAVLIPADWTVQRRPDGPGSPRVRAGPPGDAQTAINITWSYSPQDTLAHAEEVLRRAAAAEPPGVFEFEPPGPREGRAAIAYRERRPGLLVRWTVLLDGSSRIAVGCQSAPDREPAVRTACALAVRSAREIGPEDHRAPGRPF